MILNISECPKCGGTSFAVEVKTWVNVEAEDDNASDCPHFHFDNFDDEDGDYAAPIEGGTIICRDCEQEFVNSVTEPAVEKETSK